MGLNFKKLKNINDKLQKSADRINPHWIVVYLAILILFIDLIVVIFLTYSYIWELAHPDYLIITRIENLNIENFTHFSPNNELIDEFEFWNICGSRTLVHIFYRKDVGIVGNPIFFQVLQAPLTYSVSYIPSKKEGTTVVSVISTETGFSIESKRSLNEIPPSRNVVDITEKKYEIYPKTFTEDEQFLFEVIPDRDAKIEINCFSNRRCKIANMNFELISVPPYCSGITFHSTGAEIKFPKLNLSRASIYSVNIFDGSLKELTTDIPTTNEKNIVRTTRKDCVPEGKLYLNRSQPN